MKHFPHNSNKNSGTCHSTFGLDECLFRGNKKMNVWHENYVLTCGFLYDIIRVFVDRRRL